MRQTKWQHPRHICMSSEHVLFRITFKTRLFYLAERLYHGHARLHSSWWYQKGDRCCVPRNFIRGWLRYRLRWIFSFTHEPNFTYTAPWADVELVPYTSSGVNPPTNTTVHEGFLGAYNSVASAIISTVKSQLASYPSYSLVTSGHRLAWSNVYLMKKIRWSIN